MRFQKKLKRLKRAKKTRVSIRQQNVRRLVVTKSSQHIYAQVIEPGVSDTVIASASTLDKEIKASLSSHAGNKESAKIIGRIIAERAKAKGVTSIAFDRSGNKYHGRIKILAEAAREAGLEF
ncbi:MAG: 50S ribosomal protein L18 [Gammaproteobacteria bacterium]|nr:50S ribosomal protein L18 [Gammaproteobacteria bacterium]